MENGMNFNFSYANKKKEFKKQKEKEIIIISFVCYITYNDQRIETKKNWPDYVVHLDNYYHRDYYIFIYTLFITCVIKTENTAADEKKTGTDYCSKTDCWIINR